MFKKNGFGNEVEDQGQWSLSFVESSQGVVMSHEWENNSPDVPIASSSCIDQEDDKDDSWMQFITDDGGWGTSNPNAPPMGGDFGEEVSPLNFSN